MTKTEAMQELNKLIGRTLGRYRPDDCTGPPGLVRVVEIDFEGVPNVRLICQVKGWETTIMRSVAELSKPSKRQLAAESIIAADY